MAKIKLDKALEAANWAKEVGPADKEIGMGRELKRLDDLNDDIDEDVFESKGLDTPAKIEVRLGDIDAALKKTIKAALAQAAAVEKLAKKCEAAYKKKPDDGKAIAAASSDVGDAARDYAKELKKAVDVARAELQSELAKQEKAIAAKTGSCALSGPMWVKKFPGSSSISDLTPSFRTKVNKFIAAIEAAGGEVRIEATFRPLKRAFLMHYSFMIDEEGFDPADVPEYSGIDINWVHPTPAASIRAARQMNEGYGTVYQPALKSNHTAGRAIDMTITRILGKTMKDAKDNDVEIRREADLHDLGATYGVKKLVRDPPHWSEDGK